jgi:hypothetical protein
MRSDVDDLLRPAFGVVLRHRMIEHHTVMLVAPHDSYYVDPKGQQHQQWLAVSLEDTRFRASLSVVGPDNGYAWEVVG